MAGWRVGTFLRSAFQQHYQQQISVFLRFQVCVIILTMSTQYTVTKFKTKATVFTFLSTCNSSKFYLLFDKDWRMKSFNSYERLDKMVQSSAADITKSIQKIFPRYYTAVERILPDQSQKLSAIRGVLLLKTTKMKCYVTIATAFDFPQGVPSQMFVGVLNKLCQ